MIAPMERLGFFGIFKVTTRIIHSNFKHFLCISLIFLLPYAFLIAFTPPINTKAIAASIAIIYNATTGGQLSPSRDDNDNDPIQPNPYPTLSLIITIVSGLFIVLVSVPPLTFSICRGYLNKNLKLKGSLKAIPRSIKNIIITRLCLFATFMGVFIAITILIVCFHLILSAVNVNPSIPVAILSIGLIVGLLYFGLVCSLAYPSVTILEENRGWDAIRRSIYLLDGSKWPAFWLIVFFSICGLFLQISVSKDASMLCKFSVAALRVTLQALIALYSMATQVVLLLSCKIHHKEPVETLVAGNAEFGEELANLSKYMDIESANSLNA